MSVPGYLLAWARLPGPARLLAEVRRRRESGWREDRCEVSLGWSPSERGLPGAFTWRMPEGCTAYEEELLEDLLSDLKGDTLGP